MAASLAGVRLTLDDGTDLTATVNPRLTELTLTEKRGGEADELSITLQNHDGRLAAPSKGRVIALRIGWESGDGLPLGLVDKGRFRVDEIEESGPPDIITLRARSADLTGDYRKRRTQSWRATTLGAVLGRIAARNALTAKVHPALAGRPIDAIEQHNKSDMAFVKDLGSRYDALATWKDRTLIFLPVGAATTAGGQAMPTILLERTAGWTWRFGYAERDEQDGAEAQWHDQAGGRRRTVKSGGSNRKRLKRVYASEAEAKQAADAAAAKGARGARTFDYELGVAIPWLQPNTRVMLQGWNATIDGLGWLVESVETTLNSAGLGQRVTLESA